VAVILRVTSERTFVAQLAFDAQHQRAQPFLDVGGREVADAEAGAADLGLVRRADAPAGGGALIAKDGLGQRGPSAGLSAEGW